MNSREKQLIKNLNWKFPREVQEEAIKEIISDLDIDPSILIRPFSKDYWEMPLMSSLK